MKILEKNSEKLLLEGIDNLYCTASNINYGHSLYDIEKRPGQQLVSPQAKIKNRTFSVAGTFEAESPAEVEAMRSYIISSLLNKRLKVFLEDDAEIYYNCILDGAVNITYYRGYNISRCFSLSFNLLAYEGVGWGKELIPFECSLQRYKEQGYIKMENRGNLPTFMRVAIWGNNSFTIKADKTRPFFSTRFTGIYIKKEKQFDNSTYYDLFRFTNSYEETTECANLDIVDIRSIMNPPTFRKGCEYLRANTSQVICENLSNIYIGISYRPCYI